MTAIYYRIVALRVALWSLALRLGVPFVGRPHAAALRRFVYTVLQAAPQDRPRAVARLWGYPQAMLLLHVLGYTPAWQRAFARSEDKATLREQADRAGLRVSDVPGLIFSLASAQGVPLTHPPTRDFADSLT